MNEEPVTAARSARKGRIQVKICGLTMLDQALSCVELGADVIGLVFYPGSPRYVDRKKAREISAAVGARTAVAGVFVNESFQAVMEVVNECGLSVVQLHGHEPPEQIGRLREAGLVVLKALFHAKRPFLEQATDYDASAFLLECGTGRMPGGNAKVWDWAAAEKVSRDRPVVLAGGLNAENVPRAIRAGKPDAVDVSSGVERLPGVKDLEKVASFIDTVHRMDIDYRIQQLPQGEAPC